MRNDEQTDSTQQARLPGWRLRCTYAVVIRPHVPKYSRRPAGNIYTSEVIYVGIPKSSIVNVYWIRMQTNVPQM